MASQGVAANSRLAQMQMRFQQKQMQEREQRRIEMTGGVSATSETTVVTTTTKTVGNGKVRQMFDERRRGAGIDRSNPLKPITTTTSTISTSKASGSNMSILNAAVTSRGSPTLRSKPQPAPIQAKHHANGRRTMTRSETFEQSASNGNYDEVDNLDNETFPKGLSSLSLNENNKFGGDRNNNSSSSANASNSNNDPFGRVKSSNSIKLNPVVTKKSPSVSRSHVRHATPAPSPGGSANANRTPVPTRTLKSTPEKPVTVRVTPKSSAGKMSGSASKMVSNSVKPPPRIVAPPTGMATCRFCQRHFNEERLAKHEEVCQKMANSRRKVFDATKHRLKGTDAEKYVKKPTRSGGAAAAAASAHVSKQSSTYSSAAAAAGLTMPPKKNNWRKKHEEFIAAIRAAKQVQSHLARGGKLSDLPPPPPSENPDYIQCPHCMRRFNQAAAERHIPRCATMIHNKPKPNAGAKKR